jgi:uncharacterized protein YciI
VSSQAIDPAVSGFELYVILSTPFALPEELKAQLPAHLAHQKELERDGVLFAAGPLAQEGSERPVGGLIIIRAASYQKAREIAEADPMHISGARRFTLQKWRINEGSISLKLTCSDHVGLIC